MRARRGLARRGCLSAVNAAGRRSRPARSRSARSDRTATKHPTSLAPHPNPLPKGARERKPSTRQVARAHQERIDRVRGLAILAPRGRPARVSITRPFGRSARVAARRFNEAGRWFPSGTRPRRAPPGGPRATRAASPRVHHSPVRAVRAGRGPTLQRGRSLVPIRNPSTACAAWRPSRHAGGQPAVHHSPVRAVRAGRGPTLQRGRSLVPIKKASTACAAWRPSRIAHTTRLCPRRMSPAANTRLTLVA